MEVVGVVLGAVPLILYALDNYKQVGELVNDTRNPKNTITTIRNNIFLQRKMLVTTLQTLDRHFTKDTTMIEIEAALKSYHPSEVEQFMSIISEMNDMMKEIWDWSNVKRSFGKKRRDEICNKLTMWNISLTNCGLEKREFLPDNEAVKINEVQRRYDEKGTTKIRENVRALHEAISSALECDCPDAHNGKIQLNWHEKKHLVPGTFSFAISSKQTPSSPAPTPRVKLCTILQSSQEHQPLPVLGSNTRKRISLKSINSSTINSSTDTKRTVALPMLLRKEVDQPTNQKLGLDWKQRFRIAAALVWGVFHLCDSPWLKESLNDEMIHFFLDQNQATNSPCLSGQPYLSYNFHRSQSNSTSQPFEGSSSAQFQSNQIRSLMLYTLAIRLIELGRNKPFAKLRNQYQNINTPTACDDYKVAEHQIDELRLDSGSFYAGAVECCLRFGSLERVSMNTFENKSFSKSFFDGIVAPIQATLELRLNL
ncbi:hypothetical protein DM02DRAFT_588552 [Periconia macrospinosa]|uniref:DUF7580 domain-containing protein n=1 Tax=Periconia macrospinosa TaxID=97972 RepID=A0A2V1E0A1_9PLEO|nr:hypothetical protein DM02DRAFT_588552 [Periconia macrospinosa]